MNKILSEESFEKIMRESAIRAIKEFAEKADLSFSMELLLLMYSADLTGVVHDRLFEEVKK